MAWNRGRGAGSPGSTEGSTSASYVDPSAPVETHAIVTPARNEAANLRRLGSCLVEQTWRPETWIVVDNGSTDGTAEVVRNLARAHSWIRLVSTPSDAKPVRGHSSVRAFNIGVKEIPTHADLITGLDADISFGPDYLDGLRREFEKNPRLGIAAGLCYEPLGDGWEPVHVTRPNLRGASLTYRRECLMQLLPGGALRMGWDCGRQGQHPWLGNSELARPQLLPPSSDRRSRRQSVLRLRGGRDQRALHVVPALVHAPADALPDDHDA